MEQELLYGNELVRLYLPDPHLISRFDLIPMKNVMQEELLANTLKTSEAMLRSLCHEAKKIVVVVSDYSRPTGTRHYLPLLLDQLSRFGIREEQIAIIIALGLHRKATEEEIVQLVGKDIFESAIRIENHDPDTNITYFASYGINSTAAEADVIILTGSVTFHPLAGFSGGFKSLVPGIAARESIIENHRMYFSQGGKHPFVNSGEITGNPISKHIFESSQLVPSSFYCLNVVMNGNKDIVFAASGDVYASFISCSEFLLKHNSVSHSHPYPLVIASGGGFPYDMSFYQCMKVLTNAAKLTTEGGTILVFAQCSQGWEIDKDLLQWFSLSLAEIEALLQRDFRMDGLAIYMAARIIKTHTVYLFSDLGKEEVLSTGMKWLDWEMLATLINENMEEVAILPYGSLSLPLKEDACTAGRNPK